MVSCPRKPLGKVQARRLPRPSSLRHARPGPFVTATAHAAGTLTYNSHHSRDADSGVLEELLAGPKEAYHAPAVLPPTPEAATLNAVLPYLARLALGEAQLYWRVGGALIALFA